LGRAKASGHLNRVWFSPYDGSKDCVKPEVPVLREILSKKAQDRIAVLRTQPILLAIASIRVSVSSS